MKKALLLILSIAIILSTMCIAVVANDPAPEEQVLRGDTVTVVFALPQEYAKIKSGALTFAFDEKVFELVEGSAKWMLTSMFIKDVDEASKNAIFAFSSEKAISGSVFTLTLKVKEKAAYGNYHVTANMNLNQGAYVFDIVNVISVVEEQIEFDDPTTPADFAAVVNRVNGANATEDTYTAITEALVKYNALTSAEKEAAAGDYEKLLGEINAYNNNSEEVNQQAENTLEVAFSALSGVFAYSLKRLSK